MKISTLHRNYLDDIPHGVVFLDNHFCIVEINRYACEVLNRDKEEVLNRIWFNEFPGLLALQMTRDPEQVQTMHVQFGEEAYVAQRFPIVHHDKRTGYGMTLQKATDLEKLSYELDSYKNLSADLKAIFDTSYDVIYVSDGKGITLRVSSACEKLWGYKESDLVGKSIYELEKIGVYRPSVTRLVLERKDKVSVMQTTKTGRRLMVVGTPIKDEEGNIVRVVNASRDISEVSRLQNELDELRQLTEGYKQELMELRRWNETETKIVYRSVQMKDILTTAQKVAKVDSTVLLLGETGVGKEVLASFIHQWSSRRKKPFITFNCASIPEKLLEYELFGNEEQIPQLLHEGKMGLFEMAHEGTLFLDEISTMPLSVQAKLVRVLERMEVTRVGGVAPIKLSVRIIASSNRNLALEMDAGQFLPELYYRLHVVPIHIPPLRERKDDILPLTLHFMDKLNKKYGMNKSLPAKMMDQFMHNDWPGNVRELHNLIERLIVTSDEDVIRLGDLPESLRHGEGKINALQLNQIVPLRDAIEQVEKELLAMAREKYGSSTRMAEVLQVNQSTISRKLQQYGIS